MAAPEMRRPDTPRPKRPKLWGRHPLTVGALALAGVSGYELWVRLDDFWAWTSGIRHLSAVRGTPFLEDMAIIFEDPAMRQLGFKLLFLFGCVLFALICLLWRNRAGGAWALLTLDVALAIGGGALGLYSLNPGDWLQVLKLVPIALIAFGCVANRLNYRRHFRKPPGKGAKSVARN